jgi:hypothetical protein
MNPPSSASILDQNYHDYLQLPKFILMLVGTDPKHSLKISPQSE